MVEEAVEEVLELVRKAGEAMKANTVVDDFNFILEGIFVLMNGLFRMCIVVPKTLFESFNLKVS